MPEQFPGLDLGKSDYQPGSNDDDDILGLNKYVSKPSPKPYQPFGGPIQQAPQTFAPAPQPAPKESYSPQSIFSDDDLDAYDRAKKDYKDISSYSSNAGAVSRKKNSIYKDFRSQKFLPFYESLGGFGDYDDDEEFASEIDSMYDQALKTSQMDDGFFGPSDEKLAARESLKKFALWNQPNGLRDQYRRLRAEKDQYQGIADAYDNEKIRRLEQLTAIPIPAKRALDDALSARKKGPPSSKQVNSMLDSMPFEQASYSGAGLANPDKIDPRSSILFDDIHGSAKKRQSERMAMAKKGDFQGLLSRRNQVARDRQLRDKGLLFSLGGMLDGRPIGMSRNDVDLLDIDDLKKYGIEEYKGVPIEQAINELGGQERLEVAKVLQSVRANYNEFEKAQIEWLTSGRKDELKTKMDQAREAFQNSVGMANEYGLTDELVEQNEKKGFFARLAENIGNAFSRGSKLNEMSKYSMDFFTNSADINDIDKFIDLAEEIGEIPTGSAAQKFQQYKSKGLWDSISNLFLDNTEAIPELFVESLSSFLPAYLRTGMKTIPGGAAIGFATPVPGGTIAGAKIAARANWGVASFVLEYSGMILEGMQELNIDWQNPKVFAAAWNNEIIRDEIKDKALKKGLPIALMDSISGLMAGRISAGLHHIKGGKLLDGKAWKKSKATYPRFTGFQRAANIGTEIGADAALGMGGEFLGQAWSKEPGEAWDYNAIAAEGVIGLGPGLVGGAYEFAATRNLDLSNTPFQYQNVKNTPDGQSGTVNLAGFTNEFNSFNTAQGAASHVINQGNYANPEARNNAAKVLTDLMARLYALNPAEMKDLKLVVADRTPFADKEMEGSYHHDRETDTSVIYLNRNKIGQDPLGVFLHESGHLARKLMISEQKLLDIYQAIGENAQRDSFAQYTLKIPGIRYGKLSESQKSQVDSAWGKMGEMRRAEEWFSYQWASLLAGNNIDASIKTEYQNFLTQVIHPTMEKFLGGKTTGGTKAQQFELNQIILQKMGFNPNGIREDGNARFGEYYHERPGMAQRFLNKDLPIQQMGDEEALNSMMRKVSIIAQTQGLAQAKRVVEAANKILGEKVLPTDMSAYTKRELRSKVLPIADARVAAEDAVATAEVYETLEGEDAKNAVNELVETKEKAVEKEVTPDVSASRKQVLKNKEVATKTRKVAKIEKAIDEKEQAVASEINQVQNLMPGSEIVDSKDGKFRLKLRLPGTRKALPARIFETREEAEKEEKKFYADEREKLTNISKKVSSLMKLAQNEKEFEKAAAETKKALLARLKAGKKQLTKEDLSNSLSDEDKTRIVEKSKTEEGLTENDLSYGQIIAEMMGLNDLMDNAIFSSSLLAMDLADVSSGKAPDGQRVVDAIEKYNQQVEFATGAIDSRISELELKKKELLLEKQLLQGQITQDVYEKKQEGLTALGSKQAKKSGYAFTHKIVAVLNRAGNKVQYREWDGKKFGPIKTAERSPKDSKTKKEGDYIERYNSKTHKYLSKEYAAAKAVAEKEKGINPKFLQYKQNKNTDSAKPQAKAKAKAKPEPRKEKEPEAKKVDSPRLKQIESELTEIDKTLTLLREYRNAIEPEKAAIDWKDTPHFGYRKYVGPGDGPTKENKGFEDKNFEPYTLGQLAEYDRDGTPIWQKTYNKKAKRETWKRVTVSDTQKTLFNYTDWRKHLPDETKKEDKPEPKAEEVKEEKAEASDVVVGDIWAQDGYKIVSTNLGGVHGRGLAKQAKDKGFINQSNVDFASSPEFILPPAELFDDVKVITLAVKGKEPKTQKVKGKSFSEQVTGKNVELLSSEVDKLIAFARKKKDEKFYLPYIGLGFGEGNPAEIQPILNKAAKEPNIFLISKDEATVKKYEDSFKPGVRRDATTRSSTETVEDDSKKKKSLGPITESEWSGFVKTGKVSQDRLKDILKKYTQGQETTTQEQEIFNEMREERDALLKDFTSDPTALGSGIDKSQAFNPFVNGRKLTDKLDWFGNRTVQEYVDILDAVRASAALPEKVGSRRYTDGDRIFFQSENGTSVAAMMLFRLKEMDKKAGFNGRKITSGSIEDISLAEMSVYELATGRALEILDDRDIRGSKQQRYHQLIERRAYEMSQDIKEYEKLLKAETDPKKKEGIERNIERLGQQLLALYFDYDEAGSFQGEETGGFFPKIHGGKQWSETLTEFLFFKEKEQAVDKILDIWEEDIARDQGAGLGKKPKESRNRPAWGLDAELWAKYTDIYRALLRASGKSKEELKKDLDALKDAHIERRDEAQRTYQEEYEKKLADEGVQAAKKWDAKVTAPEDYEFFAMGEKATQQVPAKNDHGSFARGNVDEGVDVISMFAKGRTENFSPERTTFGTGFGSEQASPDLARDLERRLDKAIADKAIEVLKDEKYQDIDLFEITRANGQKLKVKRVGGLWKKANGHVLDKDLEDIAREEFIKNDPKLISQIKGVIAAQDAQATSGVTSGGAVSPLQFVEYLLSVARDGAGLKKAILSLQYIPSSEVKDGTLKQMPGGPGGGILPYVWKDFVTEVYKLLKINEEPVFTPAKDPKKSGWQNLSEEVTRTVKNKDGKQTRVSEPNTLWTNGVPDVDAMIAQSKKIIQAVYDSGRIMLAPGRALDEAESNKNSLNASNVLQQDPSVHTSSLEDFIKNDAPEGSLDNMEIDDGGLQKTFQADQQESAALPDEGIKTLKDTDTIPQSFATANDPIASKLEGTETNKKLFNLKKDGKALSLKKVIQEFRTDEVFWNAFGLPTPPAPKQAASSSVLKKVGLTKEQVQNMTGKESKEILQFAKDLKVHPNYPYLKARVLNPGTTSLGSNYSLSSGVPLDSIKATSMLTRMANKVGLGEKGRQEMRDYLKKHKDRFSKQGIISAALDSSRPATSIISKALKDVGIDNKELLDQLDVKGLIQQYFGKTDEIVRQAHLRFIEPIEDALADHGISSKEFGEYLLARAAPSRNAHIKKLYTEYLNDAKEEKKEAIQEMLDKYGDRMSGISNENAIKVVKEFEQNKSFRAFLKDERAPLQKFYAFNREALRHRAEGGLMRTDQEAGGINEEIAMVKASSSFNWKKDGGSEFMYQENGKDNNYSYAPMQGFEGETETLFDNERAYEVAGKSSTAAGRAWDMPKHKFLFDGSFGRFDENAVAPDPEMVFPVSQSQYYEGAILGQKNMVSNAIGQVFEILRSVAFNGEKAPLDELPYLDLSTVPGGKEILKKLEKDPSIKETTRQLFEGKDAIFEKKFEKMVEKKHYEIQTKDIEVDNKKVDGMVMARRMINTEFQNNPSVFVYRQNGEPRYIKMKNNERGMRFASAIKNLRYETLPTFLREVNGVTRFMASMFTSKNPAFIFPNFVRDLGTAYLHLSEDDKQAFVKNVFRPKRLKGFIGGIFKVEQKKARGEATLMELPKDPEQAKKYAQQLLADNDYEKMYQFAVQAGAKVGYFRTKPVTEMIEDMQKLHKKGGKNKKSERGRVKQFIETLDSVNTSVENSIRMSAFWSAIENGRSVHEAANISRNVTVDFNQKGTMTQTLGAFFVFFGASMNSIDRMMTMFQRRGYKRSRNLIAAVAAASFALNIFNRLMDDDEDEAEPGYDRIPSYRRDTMALFSTPGKDNTGYFGIPLPLGYNMFWTMGQTAADFFAKHVMGRGGAGSVEFMERNMSATLNAFNPVGGASLATALIPTSIKPLVEVWANQNFMGSPIRMEDRPFEAPKPAHMMDPKRTQEHWTAISEGINKLMGGNDDVKGSLGGLFGSHPLKSLDDSDVRWNISGSQLEHILLGYTGGPGQIVNAMFGGLIWPGLPGTNEDYGKFDANKMPITNRFYRSSTSDASTKNAYYQIRTATLTAERAVRAAKIAGSKEYSSMRNEMKDLLALSDSIKYADAFKSKVRKQKSKIEEAKNLNQDQKFQRIAELEKREHDAYVAVIKKAQSLGIS